MSTYCHQSPGNAHLRPFLILCEVVIFFLQIRSIVRNLEAMSERSDPHRTKRLHLFTADAHHLIQILLRHTRRSFSFFSHPCSLLLNIHDFVLNDPGRCTDIDRLVDHLTEQCHAKRRLV